MVLGRNMAVTRSAAWLARVASSARTLARPRILRQGVAAAKRGNLEAAFALLREEVAARPDLPGSTLLFWELALACERAARGRPADGAAGAQRGDRRPLRGGGGSLDRAGLAGARGRGRGSGPDADPARAARPHRRVARRGGAEARARAADRRAPAGASTRSSGALTPALALRLVEEARGLDAEVAQRAAQAALASSELHEAKRARLEELLRALKRGAWPETAPAEPPPPERRAPPLSQTDVEAAAARLAERMPPPGRLRVSEVIPVELGDDGLVALEGEDDRRTRIDYRAIEALAVGEVAELGDGPVLVMDLLLRAPRPGRPRSVLRMRSDAFDAAVLFPDRTDAGQALRALLAELLDRSAAVPLPDPDSALGVRPQRFESLAAFESAVQARLEARARRKRSAQRAAGERESSSNRIATDREQIEAARVGGARRKVAPAHVGHPVAHLCLAPHQQREAGEEPFDHRPRYPVAQAQRVEAHDPADALRALLEVAANRLAGSDSAQLDASGSGGASSSPAPPPGTRGRDTGSRGRTQRIGRRDQRDAVRGEQAGDRVQVLGRVLQVLDHLEADDQREAALRERDPLQPRAHEMPAAGSALAIGPDPVEADHAGMRARQARGAVARPAAEVEHAAPRQLASRQLVGRLVPRQIDRKQLAAGVQSLSAEGDVVRQAASCASASASRANSRAKVRPISSRSEVRLKESTRLIAMIVSGGARSRNR